MKIGLFGGSFNPIHLGHLVLANEALYKFGLDKVIFMPAFMPPHKKLEGNATPDDRFNMVRLAIKGHKGFEVSDHEIRKEGRSYTIDTIKFYKEKTGGEAELVFLTGFDSLAELKNWKDVDDILRMTKFVVARRPGYKPSDLMENMRVYLLDIPQIDVSSTMIRERVKKNTSVDFIVPPLVKDYIIRKRLYS